LKLVPQSLLKSIYVKNSLKYMQNGFRFSLANRTRPLVLEKVLPIEIDGEPWPADGVSFTAENETVQASDISQHNTWTVPRGTVMVRVQGRVIGQGRHRIRLPVVARALGTLDISFTAKVSEGGADTGDEPGP
jgi:hypothetical protein